jgi:hypothetical protein
LKPNRPASTFLSFLSKHGFAICGFGITTPRFNTIGGIYLTTPKTKTKTKTKTKVSEKEK